MFENFFSTKCMMYVDENGRALSGEALENAQRSISAKRCGHQVHRLAKFCSKCGSPAPNRRWRCAGCGEWIGQESAVCFRCGKIQNHSGRIDIRDGVWRKGDDVFAQKFELEDVKTLLGKSLSITHGQCAILLNGGNMINDVLPPGNYSSAELQELLEQLGQDKHASLIMVDFTEIDFPVAVENLYSKEELALTLTCSAVLRFDPENAEKFLTNIFERCLNRKGHGCSSTLGYDEVASFIIADIESAIRDDVCQNTIDELFKDPVLRINMEDRISQYLKNNLLGAGMAFIRLKEMEFHSPVFEKLRSMSGDIEEKRREIEFQLRADELANDAVRKNAVSEKDVEEFMDQLAHEKDVKDYVRAQEMAHLSDIWKFERAKADQEAQDHFEINDQQHANALRQLSQEGEIKRRQNEHAELIRQKIEEQRTSLTLAQVELQIQEMRTSAEQTATERWLDIQQKKAINQQALELERIKAYQGVDSKVLAAAIDDTVRGDRIAHLAELELQQKMTPELLLAAAAARGVPEAAAALASMSREQQECVERAREENKEIYEKMLAMNERMFNQAAESMAKGNAAPNTTIVK